MTYSEKYDRAMAELEQSSIAKKAHMPFHFKLLQSAGLEIRPPHYCDRFTIFIVNAIWMAILFPLILLSIQFLFASDLSVDWATGAFCAIAFGGFMAWEVTGTAKRHGLSQWEDL